MQDVVVPALLMGGAFLGNYLAAKCKQSMKQYNAKGELIEGWDRTFRARVIPVAARFLNFTFLPPLAPYIGASLSYAYIAALSDRGDQIFTKNMDWRVLARVVLFTASSALIPVLFNTPASIGIIFCFNVMRFATLNPNRKASEILCDALFGTLCTTTMWGLYSPVVFALSTPIKAAIDGCVTLFIKPIVFDKIIGPKIIDPACNFISHCAAKAGETKVVLGVMNAADFVDSKVLDFFRAANDTLPDFQVA